MRSQKVMELVEVPVISRIAVWILSHIEDFSFREKTGDGEAVYTYALTWLGEDRFRADVTYKGSSYTLLFDRVG